MHLLAQLDQGDLKMLIHNLEIELSASVEDAAFISVVAVVDVDYEPHTPATFYEPASGEFQITNIKIDGKDYPLGTNDDLYDHLYKYYENRLVRLANEHMEFADAI